MMEKIIFKDELCDAKWSKTGSDTIELFCVCGTLKVTGTIQTQFKAYHNWCKACSRKRIVDRKDLKDTFDSVAREIEKVLEII